MRLLLCSYCKSRELVEPPVTWPSFRLSGCLACSSSRWRCDDEEFYWASTAIWPTPPWAELKFNLSKFLPAWRVDWLTWPPGKFCLEPVPIDAPFVPGPVYTDMNSKRCAPLLSCAALTGFRPLHEDLAVLVTMRPLRSFEPAVVLALFS